MMTPDECDHELSQMNWPAYHADHGDLKACAEGLVDGQAYRKTDLRLSSDDVRVVDAHLRTRGLTIVDDGDGWWMVMTLTAKAERDAEVPCV